MRLTKEFAICLGMGMVASLPSMVESDMCEIYPDCRALTVGEIELARSIFGDSINYDAVSVINGKFMGVFPVGQQHGGMAPNGNIYINAPHLVSEDYSQDLSKKRFYIHEMSHVWQTNRGVNVIMAGIGLHVLSSQNPYLYSLEDDTVFDALSIEQQAQMIENYFYQDEDLRMNGVDALQARPACLENTLRRNILESAITILDVPPICASPVP